MTAAPARDYTPITELPGGLVTAEQQARLSQRYGLARSHAAGRRVLEVACGAGLGLGFVADTAQLLVGGDYTAAVLDVAQERYRSVVPLARFDAQRLPFRDASFDLVLCLEAIYYFPEPELFLTDCHRLLSETGILLIGSENKAWRHFVPSPLSARYYTVPELNSRLAGAGFGKVEFFGSFEAESYSPLQRVRAGLRRAVTATGVFQRWPQMRELLKPLVYRQTAPLGINLHQDEHDLPPLVPLDSQTTHSQFKVIYALAHALGK